MNAGIDDLDVIATLDTVESLFASRRVADAGMFELAAHFADLHPTQSLSGGPVLPGTERAVRLGGEGTPRVAEFAVAELGARMQMGSWAARSYVADALDVRHRLPKCWERVVDGTARIPWVRLVASKTRHLSVEAAGCVDAAMADFVDGSLPYGRFETRLAGKVVSADPVTAAEREAERAAEQFAKRTRASEHGTAGFYVRSTIGVVARLDATVAYVAEALKAFGDDDDLDLRRVKALLVLANPTVAVELLAAYQASRATSLDFRSAEACGLDKLDHPGAALDRPEGEPDHPGDDALSRMDGFARRVGFEPTRLPDWLAVRVRQDASPTFTFDWARLLPSVTLNLHLSAEDLVQGEGGVARWEGEGPVTDQFVHDHLRPLHSYVIQPVIDLAGLAPVDAYEIPDRHRRAVHLRSPADTFPYSSNLSSDVDLDHTESWRPACGATRPENLAPLGRFGHRVKTHGRWTVKQPFRGIEVWRDPHGQIYLVDHTGTHKVTGPGATAGPARRHDPGLQVVTAAFRIELDEAG